MHFFRGTEELNTKEIMISNQSGSNYSFPKTTSKVTFAVPDAEPASKPLKAIVLGPPASGKTTLVKRLNRRYGALHITVKTVVDETIADLRKRVRSFQALLIAEPEVDREDKERRLTSCEEQLRYITKQYLRSENKRLPDDYVVRLMKAYLSKGDVVANGYILDGYPKTIQQAKELFGQVIEKPNNIQQEETGGILLSKPSNEEIGDSLRAQKSSTTIGSLFGNASVCILPDYVVCLEATDFFLCDRIMRLSEREVKGTHYDEASMIRRMAEYRMNNTVETTVLKFFDDYGIHPILLDVTQGDQDGMEAIFKYLCVEFGEPLAGLGLSEETEEELKQLEIEESRIRREEARIERELMEQSALGEYQEKMEKWAETLDMLKQEEEKVIVAQSEPLRFYLMKYVFPVLTKGLLEVARTKPDDPVDFLAEFLFKENTEGKIFDPSYTEAGDSLLKQYNSSVEPVMKEILPPPCKKS